MPRGSRRSLVCAKAGIARCARNTRRRTRIGRRPAQFFRVVGKTMLIRSIHPSPPRIVGRFIHRAVGSSTERCNIQASVHRIRGGTDFLGIAKRRTLGQFGRLGGLLLECWTSLRKNAIRAGDGLGSRSGPGSGTVSGTGSRYWVRYWVRYCGRCGSGLGSGSGTVSGTGSGT